LLTHYANWFGKFLRSKVVLEHPEAPEDTRVLNLFRNRAELKKALGDAQDEVHRLKDRVKLQEAATARVREQLEGLESRLGVPMSGLYSLVHYQLRDLWSTGHGQIGALLLELAQQREDRERRQFLADLNRQLFERQQVARADCAQAEHVSADVRAKLAAIHNGLLRSQGWWQYFTRRELLRRRVVMQAEMVTADELLEQARGRLMQIEEQGGAKYPGLSLESRRMLNLTAIACAQVLAMRLAPAALLARAADAMSRSEPRIDPAAEAPAALALMQEIARAKAAMSQNVAAIRTDVRRLVDQLAPVVKYRAKSDTVPAEDTVREVLKAATGKSEAAAIDVLEQDLWSLSDLFYAEGD
jgi:hypothetical protein